MNLMEYVEDQYEHVKMGTMDFCLSEYLLMHIFEIENMSLADLAKETGIGKSTIATFFNSETIPGGYVAFKKALSTEIGNNVISIKSHLKWVNGLLQDTKKFAAVSDLDITEICQKILASEKVIFVGAKRYRDCMMTLVSFLRLKGIKSRYIVDSCMQKYEEELAGMKEDELIIFLLPDKTYTEYHLAVVAKASYANAYKNCTGKKIYICASENAEIDKDEIIPFRLRNNPHEMILSVIHLCALMFQKCVELSRIDINERIYIL